MLILHFSSNFWPFKLNVNSWTPWKRSRIKRHSKKKKTLKTNLGLREALTYTIDDEIMLILPFSNHMDLIKYLVKRSLNLIFIVAIFYHQQPGNQNSVDINQRDHLSTWIQIKSIVAFSSPIEISKKSEEKSSLNHEDEELMQKFKRLIYKSSLTVTYYRSIHHQISNPCFKNSENWWPSWNWCYQSIAVFHFLSK